MTAFVCLCIQPDFTSVSAQTPPPPESSTVSARAQSSHIDVVHLKSGKELTGRVRTSSAANYIIEVHPGVEIEVPRNLVTRISFGEREGADSRKGGEGAARHLVESSRLSIDLNRRLYRPLAERDEPIEFDRAEVADVFAVLSERSGIQVTLDARFGALPDDERLWTVSIYPGTSLFDVLNEEFADKFPQASIEYKYDQLIVSLPDEETAPESDLEDL